MDTNYTRLDFIKDIKRHITEANYIKPEVVKDAPLMENVFEGKDIDMWKFPTPKWHELGGGRYIGTGSIDITVEPDEGLANLGTYRRSTRLNSSHSQISYAVFCLKKKKNKEDKLLQNAA